MDFLAELMDVTEDAESPRQFIYWAGISAISAVLKKRVFLNKHYYKLYPNTYILLVAGSGGRKGYPISVAKKLVEAVDNTKVITGRASIQGIIDRLSMTQTKPDSNAPPIGAQAYLVTGEFASFLIEDPHVFTVLTDLYDTHANEPIWSNTLKSTGVTKLTEPYLSLLGAINPAHFKNQISNVDIEGGFIGRTLIVFSDQKSKVNSLVYAPERIPDFTELCAELRQIATIEGEFHYSEQGGKLFDTWYKKFCYANKCDDNTGTTDRIHDNVLKVAMCLSASRRKDLLLKEEDIEEAIDKTIPLIKNVKRTTVGQGQGPLARPTYLVLSALINAPDNEITRSNLLRKNYGEFDALDLDRVIQTLQQARALKEDQRGGTLYYRLSPHVVEEYKELAEKNAN